MEESGIGSFRAKVCDCIGIDKKINPIKLTHFRTICTAIDGFRN